MASSPSLSSLNSTHSTISKSFSAEFPSRVIPRPPQSASSGPLPVSPVISALLSPPPGLAELPAPMQNQHNISYLAVATGESKNSAVPVLNVRKAAEAVPSKIENLMISKIRNSVETQNTKTETQIVTNKNFEEDRLNFTKQERKLNFLIKDKNSEQNCKIEKNENCEFLSHHLQQNVKMCDLLLNSNSDERILNEEISNSLRNNSKSFEPSDSIFSCDHSQSSSLNRSICNNSVLLHSSNALKSSYDREISGDSQTTMQSSQSGDFNTQQQEQQHHNLNIFTFKEHESQKNSKRLNCKQAPLDCDCLSHNEFMMLKQAPETSVSNSRASCTGFCDEHQESFSINDTSSGRCSQQQQRESNIYGNYYDGRFANLNSTDALEIINQLMAEKRYRDLQQQQQQEQLQRQQEQLQRQQEQLQQQKQKLLSYQNSSMLLQSKTLDTPQIPDQRHCTMNYRDTNQHLEQFGLPHQYYLLDNKTDEIMSRKSIKATGGAAALGNQQQIDNSNSSNRSFMYNNSNNNNNNPSNYSSKRNSSFNELSLYCDPNGGIENMVVSFLNAIN